jgi:hypothetical protein
MALTLLFLIERPEQSTAGFPEPAWSGRSLYWAHAYSEVNRKEAAKAHKKKRHLRIVMAEFPQTWTEDTIY